VTSIRAKLFLAALGLVTVLVVVIYAAFPGARPSLPLPPVTAMRVMSVLSGWGSSAPGFPITALAAG